MEIHFDCYYNYYEIKDRLQWLASKYPDLVELQTLGKSNEGRDIPIVILTNKNTGPEKEKPGFWVDGNIHSIEVTSAMMVLYFIYQILQEYNNDPKIKELLDTQVFYAIPCINPDGSLSVLSEKPKYFRSGTHYHRQKDNHLHIEDVDGDGRILQMRIPDPTGDWKISPKDPRLMIKRAPDEEDGKYYRVFPEGQIPGYDGHIIPSIYPYQQDFNRNFPINWRPEGQQQGAGKYAGSEPEIRALLDFIVAHPNIFGAITYHTYSRVILRPYSGKEDAEMNTYDLWVYEAIGEIGSKLTNFPCVSVFHHFKYHPKEVITGAFDDWAFEHRGIFSYTIELWDLPTASGVKEKNDEKNFIGWFRKHPLEHDYKIFDFVAKHSPEGLVDWYEFDHPQLGKIELGGWNNMATWSNPPKQFLKDELTPQYAFITQFASLAPKLEWRTIDIQHLGTSHYRILVVIENRGFLPTYTTHQAIAAGAVRPIFLEIHLPNDIKLDSSKKRQEINHLEGRSNKLSVGHYMASPTDNRGKAEWIIYAPQGGTIEIHAVTERAGVLRKKVEIPKQEGHKDEK